jgi:nitrite reductase (NADH) large subunit
LLAQLCGADAHPVRAFGATWLLMASVIALIAALLLGVRWDLQYAASAEAGASLDFLWRDTLWKQVSGYSVVGLSAIALVFSLRKRIKRFTAGNFGGWRIAHVAVGVLTLAGLLVHTGGRLGSNLNLLLMAAFLSLVLLGSISGALLATEHRAARPAATWKRRAIWAHILLFWPVPALLGMHVIKSYFF